MIIPVTLVYTRVEEKPISALNRDRVYWYGDMDFLTHFWKLLSLRSIDAIIIIQPKIDCLPYQDNSAGRKRLASDCYDRVLGRQPETDSAQASARG
jgi:hypothetical protein